MQARCEVGARSCPRGEWDRTRAHVRGLGSAVREVFERMGVREWSGMARGGLCVANIGTRCEGVNCEERWGIGVGVDLRDGQ
jgi:hypothetical protein